MVLNQGGESIYLRKSATGHDSKDYHFCGTFQFKDPQIKMLRANKMAPTYYLVYQATHHDKTYFYGKVTGLNLEKAEDIAQKVPSITKSVYEFQEKKASHYKIVPKNFSVAKIMEKEQQQLNIIRIYLKMLVLGGFFISLPLFLLAFFFQQGPLAFAIFLIFLAVRIQQKIPSKKESTMSSYDP